MLKLKNIVKAYNSQVILNNISITLPNKGLVSLIGTSGSGKSTLLNLIGGLDKPDQGNIIVNNKDITKFNYKELDWYRSKYVGFIFQSYNLIEYLSVKDNLSLINSNNSYILRKLDIYDIRNKTVSLLSGGEKQRVAIARAILKNPKILLCDEPTGALDSKNSSQVMKILKNLSKDRLVIVITHNKELARRYSDNIIHIKDGVISDNLEVNDKPDKMIVDKHRKINIFKIVYSHLKNKHKRNLLISLSFTIGLIALGLVLSINKGFKNSIEYEEKNYLSSYPIEISKYSDNLLSKDNESNSEDKVYSSDVTHLNNISYDYLSYLDIVDNNIKYKLYRYTIDSHIINTVLGDINNYYNEFDLLYGDYIKKKTDVLIQLDSNNRINNYYLKMIGLNNDTYDYSELIDKEFKIKKTKYTIKGIIRSKKDSVLKDNNGILFDKTNFINNIPEEIFLYPINYDNKVELINKLDNYSDIKYTDLSTSFKELSVTFMDSISVVLIAFSIITLVVSSILISILTYINIMEYRKEIGIYKSLGISNKEIKNIFTYENLLIIIKSILLSIIVIYILRIILNNLIFNMTGLSNVIVSDISIYLQLFEVGYIISTISSIIPTRYISKMKIVDILRND